MEVISCGGDQQESEKQQEKLYVCGINWVRRIVGVKRIDKQRMEELREEVGVREYHKEACEELAKRESLTRKLVRSWLRERVSQGS